MFKEKMVHDVKTPNGKEWKRAIDLFSAKRKEYRMSGSSRGRNLGEKTESSDLFSIKEMIR